MTGLNQDQIKFLLAPIDTWRIGQANGRPNMMAYDIRAHLTRVFGFANWDGEATHMELVSENHHPNKRNEDAVTVIYRCRYTLRVRSIDGTPLATYTEWAMGSARSQPIKILDEAHDLAMKGLALDTPIRTATGWSTMGRLAVGDVVFDRHGLPVRVTAKSEIKNIPCYKVTFKSGETITCDNEHLWVAKIAQGREQVHPIAALHAAKLAGKPVVIPKADELVTPHADLPCEPYYLGYWLGNGGRNSARVTCAAADRPAVVASLAAAGHRTGAITADPRSQAETFQVLGGHALLRDAGVDQNKHIPAAYLNSSPAQRRALLAGLMDSDGTVGTDGRPTFTTTDPGLRDGVMELVRTLGEKPTTTTTRPTGYGKTVTAYTVQWTPGFNPFTLTRKANKVRLRTKANPHQVVSIEEVASVPTQCISVDSPTRTYLAGKAMIPTHNTAESQALKRCAINLGDQFGLSLYGGGRTDALVQITYGHPGELLADPATVDETPLEPEVDPDSGEVSAPAQVGEESQEPAPWDVDMSSLSVEQLRGLWGDAVSHGHEAFADFAVKCFTNGAPEKILRAVPAQLEAMNQKAEGHGLKPVHLDFTALRHFARR